MEQVTGIGGFFLDDLDAIAEQLRSAGGAVDVDPSATRTAASPSFAIQRETASSSGSRWPRVDRTTNATARVPGAAARRDVRARDVERRAHRDSL